MTFRCPATKFDFFHLSICLGAFQVEGDTVTLTFEMRSGREHNTPDKAMWGFSCTIRAQVGLVFNILYKFKHPTPFYKRESGVLTFLSNLESSNMKLLQIMSIDLES